MLVTKESFARECFKKGINVGSLQSVLSLFLRWKSAKC